MEREKVLVFITSEYPYGKGEAFIEAELNVLADNFDQIVIIPTGTAPNSTMEIRRYPSNCSLFVRKSEKKSKSLFHIFRWSFLKMMFSEMSYIRKQLQLKIRLIHLKIAIKSYLKALIIRDIVVQASKNYKSEKLFIYSYWLGDGLLAALTSKSQISNTENVIIFSRAHGWDVYFERHKPPYLPWRKFMIENCDAIFCISKDGQRYMREKSSINEIDKIKLAYLGVPAPPEGSKMPDFNLPGIRIVSCSNVVKVKRVELILEAISMSKIQNIYWTHIGDGPLLKDLAKKAWEVECRRPDIQISFAGHLSPAQRDELLGSGNFQLFVNVSESEGLPVSIMEAMSFGIPVLATDVGGTPEIVIDVYNGFLLSQNPDPQEIAQTIKKFYNLTFEQKEILRQNAYQSWKEEFDAEKNYRAFKNAISVL